VTAENTQFLTAFVLLNLPEVMALVRLGRSTIYREIKAGAFPPPLRTSPRRSCWNRADVIKWVESRATGTRLQDRSPAAARAGE
jgi:prophage regulatory protein